MPCAELLNHPELRVRHALARRRPVEPKPVDVAGLVETLYLGEDDAKHGKRIQFLIDLFHVLPNDGHSMLHPEKAISHDYDQKGVE